MCAQRSTADCAAARPRRREHTDPQNLYVYDSYVIVSLNKFLNLKAPPIPPSVCRSTRVPCINLPRWPQIFRPVAATAEHMTQFHSSDYIDFLRHVTPHNRVIQGLPAGRVGACT